MTSAPAPIGFGRHTIACLAAAAIGASAYTAIAVGQIAYAGRTVQALALLPILWVGAFFVVLVASGFWLTLVWPVTRRAGAIGRAIAAVAVGAGAVAMNGWTAAAAERPTTATNLAIFGVLGIVTGLAYWQVARRRSHR